MLENFYERVIIFQEKEVNYFLPYCILLFCNEEDHPKGMICIEY